MGTLAYNLLHILRQCRLAGEEVKRSIEWLIKRLVKVSAKVARIMVKGGKFMWRLISMVGHYRTVFG